MRVELVGSSELLKVLNGRLQSIPVVDWPPQDRERLDWFHAVVQVAVQVMQEKIGAAWFPEAPAEMDRANAYLEVTVAPDRSMVDAYRIVYKHPDRATFFEVTGRINAQRVAHVDIVQHALQ